MKMVFYSLALMLIIAAIIAGGCGKSNSLGEDLEQVASDVVEIRGLAPKNEVEYRFVTSDQLREMLVSDFEEEYPQEEARIDQEVYVLLDLMEQDEDLYTILIDVFSEQLVGFYDYDSGELYVVSDREELGPVEKATFAHEYTHALQDQHFDLSSLPLQEEDNSDLATAALSLTEGDAVLAQYNYMMSYLSADELEAVLEESQQVETEQLEAAPRFISESLLATYLEGLNFVLELGGWEDINQAYADLPQSTEQILHPEKYLVRDEPQDVTMPDLESALGVGWSQLDSDVLGELSIRIYLETFVAQHVAEVAAEGWDGDRYLYLKNAEGEKLLALRSTWDSDSDAEEFFDAYISFVREKSDGAWDLLLEEATERQWRTEGLSLYLGRNGSDVLIIIAPSEVVAERVLAEFPEF
jgi:hypothetical protein